MPARGPLRPGTVPSGPRTATKTHSRYPGPRINGLAARMHTAACRPFRVATCRETRQHTHRLGSTGDSLLAGGLVRCSSSCLISRARDGAAQAVRPPVPAFQDPVARFKEILRARDVSHKLGKLHRRLGAEAPLRQAAQQHALLRAACAMPCSRPRSSTRAPHSIARVSINAGGSFPSRLASNARSNSASACSRPRSSTRASHSIARASINVGISLPPRLASNARSISASGGNLSPPCGVREYFTRA